jgi:low affinity Fe/Cu permease
MSVQDLFHRWCKKVAIAVGSPWAFALGLLTICTWVLTGPLFHYSDAWQLVINTGTTIITFLMVFLIQETQNHATLTLQLKIDELIRATRKARNKMVDLDSLSDRELKALQKEFTEFAKERAKVRQAKTRKTSKPLVE